MKFNKCLCLLLVALPFVLSCAATSTENDLDKARFALDSCSDTSIADCETAAAEADKVQVNDPYNIDASMIESSALATAAGIGLITTMSDIAETGTSEDEKFKTIHGVIVATIQDINDLRNAITAQSGIPAANRPAADDPEHNDFFFQMGFLQTVEIFARPTILAQPTATAAVTVNNITEADRGYMYDDFVAADDNLIDGGVAADGDGGDLIAAIRQNYCVLHNVTLPAADGFTLAELRDLIKCQLCIEDVDPETLVRICNKPSADMTQAAGDFQSPAIATCASFNFTACSGAGPTS